jgi:methyltransferase (TIGR00027 family)
MAERNGSSTALGTLYIRAAHRMLDAPPYILDDQVAISLLGETAVQQIRDAENDYRTAQARALRAHILLRSRFAEDRLALAVRRGITQYMILGAGFDTFALRQPAWAGELNIYEVDQPATQAMKKSLIAKAGMAMPRNAHFISTDFEQESLLDTLLRHGISLAKPTFFSWLGVTMYLKEEAIDAVLKSVTGFPPGSEIVFTFALPPETLSGTEVSFHSSLAELAASVGEPFLSYFTPVRIEAKLRDAGFNDVGFLTSEKAREQYFQERPQDLLLSKRSAITFAVC